MGILSNLMCQPFHHHGKQEGAQDWSLMQSHFHLEHFCQTLSNIAYLAVVLQLSVYMSCTRIVCPLGDRVRDHLYDISKNDLSKPVSRHFNSSNHSISNFAAFGLSIINKTKEMRLIHALGTLNPHGINERFTFCLR